MFLRTQRFAAIDIGTVTCRLLVAQIENGSLHELRRECAITNLGEGTAESGVLLRSAMRRVYDQLVQFKEIIDDIDECDGHKTTIIAMATSASRDASNSDEFVGMLAELGITLTVIPGTREADLSFRGASLGFEGQSILVADIGGGSTELIVGVAGQAPTVRHSFNIGCRRLTELFLTTDPPDSESLQMVGREVQRVIAGFFGDLRHDGVPIDRLVAVAGTATTVVSVNQHMVEYDSSVVDGTVVSLETVQEVRRELAALPCEQRCQVVGLQPGRAPVIVAGLVILEAVMHHAHVTELTVSESDILQGIILDAVKR